MCSRSGVQKKKSNAPNSTLELAQTDDRTNDEHRMNNDSHLAHADLIHANVLPSASSAM